VTFTAAKTLRLRDFHGYFIHSVHFMTKLGKSLSSLEYVVKMLPAFKNSS
jgi:hypothetical protein